MPNTTDGMFGYAQDWLKTKIDETDAEAVGRDAVSRVQYSDVYAMGKFTTAGDAQKTNYMARTVTTDAVQGTASTTGTGGVSVPLNINTSAAVRIMATARQAATGDSKAWQVTGLIKRGASGNIALVGALTKTVIANDVAAAAWDVNLTFDTTIQLRVTGEAAKTINWLFYVELVELAV